MRRFLRFRVRDGDRLVRLEDVIECIPMVQIDEEERAQNPLYRGLLHFRGRVVPVFEPSAEEREPLDPDWFLLVLQAGEQEIALIARDFDDILTCPAQDYGRLEIGGGETVTVVSFEDGVVRVIEPEKLLRR